MFDDLSFVSYMPFFPARAIAAVRPRRGFGRFLFWGAAALTLIAAWQGVEKNSATLPSATRLSINVPHVPYLTRLFAPETVTVTPGGSVFGQERAMSPSALMARWEPLIQQASQKFDIPAQWIRAVIRQESGGRTVLADNSPIVSAAGAMGIMQMMPDTYSEMAMQFGLGTDPFDPHDNIFAGAAYLNWLHHKYGYPAMFAAYNDGPGNIEDHLYRGRPLPEETRGYIAGIARFLKAKVRTSSKVTFTEPDGAKVTIDTAQVTGVQAAAPGTYAANVHALIISSKDRRGVRETVAEATALLRASGATI
ncbi:MAG TPA: lytic transglycosylase domain-containing protein [Rhizomicrobium sp.]|nr:lytic transglycosylase domain-containing protein [Rhizomicrobium sp.]